MVILLLSQNVFRSSVTLLAEREGRVRWGLALRLQREVVQVQSEMTGRDMSLGVQG